MDLNLLNSPIDPVLKKLMIKALRRYSLYWPMRTECLQNAAVSRGNYRCNICKTTGFKRNDLQVDHIDPVQHLERSMSTIYDLIIYITRLFCGLNNLQAVCKPCHEAKTMTENGMRTFYKNRNKPKKEKKSSKKKDLS